MPTINVAIPEKCHLENVSRGEVAALYVEMLLRLDMQPKILTIANERPDGTLDTTTVVYQHPVTDDVLLQFMVKHD